MKSTTRLLRAAIITLSCCIGTITTVIAQDNRNKLPNVQVKDLEGKLVNVTTFSNNQKPTIISFWATWCKPCITELESIAENYDEWQKTTGIKVIAISIDDARTNGSVKSMVTSRGWTYEIYNDYNKDLCRALGIANVPYTIVLDGEGKIAEKHSGYNPGDEYQLLEKVKKLSQTK
ncbi:TlpA family protein disulfide reductase [Chitinophaga nivalis]|uniref:TlpA family protein disulfide reductase n=1 Tax=Chitinophaga nivalis TaxID=2991709 RepID=A0ABT3IGD3_9BACT|nr:TlpA disulfide reductase family protein [Chitinophaga nivalis]MCW3467285.1 TlpA family protein disulfide reductase [Chitinophaga nivalis]MCW3483023.1 TlpA family protein disulfide reductase [Chitinophaga nivalis]